MVQELQVLRCFSCETFQSHIVKKSNKWECKICGAKQSIKQVYGKGSGKDCRVHTQKLNALRGHKEEIEGPREATKEPSEFVPRQNLTSSNNDFKRTSKWTEFMDEKRTSTSSNDCTNDDSLDCILETSITNKVQKRKIDYEVVDQFLEESCLSVENSAILKKKQSTCINKKFKFNKNVSINNGHNSCSIASIYNIDNTKKDNENKLTGPSYEKSLLKQSPCKSWGKWGKWAQYLDNEEESCSSNSQRTENKPSNHITPLLENCYKEDDPRDLKVCPMKISLSEYDFSSNMPSKHTISEVDQEYHTGFASDVSTVKSSHASCVRETKADSKQINSCDSFSTSLNKYSSCDNSSNIKEQALNLYPRREVYSDPRDKSSHSLTETHNICFGLKRFDGSNMGEDIIQEAEQDKNKFNDEDCNVEKVKTCVKNSKLSFLPLFEQETDLADADFQLDF